MGILDNPLIPVAGKVSASRRVTLLMHDRYTDPEMGFMADLGMEPGFYLVGGDRSNPLFSWPVYALVEDTPLG